MKHSASRHSQLRTVVRTKSALSGEGSRLDIALVLFQDVFTRPGSRFRKESARRVMGVTYGSVKG